MDTAKVDLRKLQLLNDRISQTIEALQQVRMSVHGLSHSAPNAYGPMGYAPFTGQTATATNYPTAAFNTPWGGTGWTGTPGMTNPYYGGFSHSTPANYGSTYGYNMAPQGYAATPWNTPIAGQVAPWNTPGNFGGFSHSTPVGYGYNAGNIAAQQGCMPQGYAAPNTGVTAPWNTPIAGQVAPWNHFGGFSHTSPNYNQSANYGYAQALPINGFQASNYGYAQPMQTNGFQTAPYGGLSHSNQDFGVDRNWNVDNSRTMDQSRVAQSFPYAYWPAPPANF